MAKKGKRSQLLRIYQQLYNALGPQHWWPADSPFEVIIGAILTQNTSWNNVERAIQNLKEKELLSPLKLYNVRERWLARIIKPSGFFNIKAKRVKQFMHFFFEYYQGSVEKMFAEDMLPLREKLLTVNGLGPETVDSILLYAGGKPVFVVDAYTKRIFSRHKLIPYPTDYDEIQGLFMDNLDHDAQLFNEYHALLVYVGKHFCKSKPRCDQCPMDGVV
jgi:endonuclease-3 related protein